MSIDLNQALEYAVAWAKEVGKIQLSYFRGFGYTNQIECVRCGNKSR